MRVTTAVGTACAGLILMITPALAGHARPGLWNSTVILDLGGTDPQMSADQMARMDSMGIKMPGMGGQSIDSKTCVTPQDAENFGAHCGAYPSDFHCNRQSSIVVTPISTR